VHATLHRRLPYAVQQENVAWAEDVQTQAIVLKADLSMPSDNELRILRSALGSIHRGVVPKLNDLFDRPVRLELHARRRRRH